MNLTLSQNLLLIENSSLTISNSFFKDITILTQKSMINIDMNMNSFSVIIFENVSIINVKTIFQNIQNVESLIKIENGNSNLSFKDCLFRKNIAFALIKIYNVCSFVNFENITFFGNSLLSQALDLERIYVLYLNYIICKENNIEIPLGGGCLNTKDILRRNFQNISIINCFSSQTTPGIKLIDHDLNAISLAFNLPFNNEVNFDSMYVFKI